ncbi:hypothetical protein Pla110_25180 [Polystyrenella longa]|uniref:DUF4034 domain-containing protein n=1 Tax=Polystyrenella longa TaxID=2528007 RepID=A0A518CNI7_9PLAN|nr:hypothetical protein [Polystyrenella longa]QDU80783.1 hypothetical protein Pla110_25180 [Polystyrenella longa]
MSCIPSSAWHRMTVRVCLFVGIMLSSSSLSAQLRELTTEEWIEMIDKAFSEPESELLPSAAVFPLVDATGQIGENGLGISTHANFLYEFCPRRLSHSSSFWYNTVFRGGGEYKKGFEISDDEIELYADSLDADVYYFPILTSTDDSYELTINRAFAGELEQEEIYRGTLTEAEYPMLANRIASEMFKDQDAQLTEEERSYLQVPQLKNRVAVERLDTLARASLSEENQVKLFSENPLCLAGWILTFSQSGEKQKVTEILLEHKDELDLDLITSLTAYSFRAIEPVRLMRVIKRAKELKSDVDYLRSLSTYLFAACETEVVDHFIDEWFLVADTYPEMHVLSRAVRKLGWYVRGTGFVSETSPEAMQIFSERNEQSYELMEKALRFNPDGWQSHLTGIEYGTEMGEQEIARQHFNSVIELRPRCRSAWLDYFRAMQPRWGGEMKNSLEFALQCAESDEWDLGIPQLSIKMLEDLADPAIINGISHPFFKDELVWEVIRTYYEASQKTVKINDSRKDFIRNQYALYGAYGEHFEEVSPVLIDLKKNGYNYDVWPSEGITYYYHDLALSQTASGETQQWCELQTTMSQGDLDRAQEITDNWDKSDPEVMEDYLRIQAGIDLGRKLQKEKEIKITPEIFIQSFARMSDIASAEGDILRIRMKEGDNKILLCPFGFENAVISGTLKFKGQGVFKVIANCRAPQDEVSLFYSTKRNEVYLQRNDSFLKSTPIDPSKSMRFQILKLKGGCLLMVESGEQWQSQAYTAAPSGFAFKAHSYEGIFETEITDLTVKLINPPGESDE